MKTERTEKLLPPGQGAAKWRLLPQGQVQGDPQGGRARPAARSQRPRLGLTERARAHGAGAGQAKKSNPQGWISSRHGPAGPQGRATPGHQPTGGGAEQGTPQALLGWRPAPHHARQGLRALG